MWTSLNDRDPEKYSGDLIVIFNGVNRPMGGKLFNSRAHDLAKFGHVDILAPYLRITLIQLM